MNITPEQIQGAPKKIGLTSDGRDIFQLHTKGGLFMVMAKKGTAFETLGVGSHRALARYIAKKTDPGLEITELSKSDWVEPENFDNLIEKYEGLTHQFRKE